MEPLSEDDCPEDVQIVSFQPFKQGEDKISLNYIREVNQKFFKQINAQIENSVNGKAENTDS